MVRKKVTPFGAATRITQLDRCIYTISVGPQPIDIPKVLTGLQWTTTTFRQTAILVGDSLCRITLQIQMGYGEKASEIVGRQIGDTILQSLAARANNLPKVYRCSEIIQRQEFTNVVSNIRRLYTLDREFRSSLNADAEVFVERQERKGRLGCSRHRAVALSREYLLEEIAIYNVMGDCGWLVEAYLGNELPTLSRIMDGEFPNAPNTLQQRVNIALSIKTRRYKDDDHATN